MKDRLSAPSTAEFPWDYDQYLESHAGQEYTFDAYVDAENKLGGTVRTEYTCTVRDVGGGEWRLVNLDMTSR